MESSVFLGENGNPNLTDGRPPPPPPPSGSEEFRATKKVRHREEDSPISLGYRERLLAGTEHSVLMETSGNNIDYRRSMLAGSERPATLEELGQGHDIKVTPGDVRVDKTTPIPAVTLSPKLKERLAQNMEFSVVVNLLGRSVGYTLLCAKLHQLWDMRGAKVVDMGGGYFLVQFASKEAYQEAALEGPWTLLGSYLQVQIWTTAFRVHHSSPLTTAVWVRISELPLHLYPSEVISAIGEAVGKVVRIDYNTSGMQRGKFARLAVNVDLTKPLVSKFTIDGEEFKVEYENLQELCFHCGMYGHVRDVCIHRPKVAAREESVDQGTQQMEKSNSTEVYGPWMIVEKRRRPQGRRRSDYEDRTHDDTPQGYFWRIF